MPEIPKWSRINWIFLSLSKPDSISIYQRRRHSSQINAARHQVLDHVQSVPRTTDQTHSLWWTKISSIYLRLWKGKISHTHLRESVSTWMQFQLYHTKKSFNLSVQTLESTVSSDPSHRWRVQCKANDIKVKINLPHRRHH